MFPKLGDDEMIGDLMKNNNGDVVDNNNNNNRLSRWHHNSSRIIRVSRASGGKDRHSKVWTSKGPRDRRVRLSVSTALQFYDLQDRLGYDQPSKAVEWLIKAAEESIFELPSLNNTNFPTDDENQTQNQTLTVASAAAAANSLSKSACSSNSDTSKNSSGLSLSRSELRDKARERARKRTAKETKERDHHPHNNNSHTSFTDLLNSGSDPVNSNRQWMTTSVPPAPSSSPMEYFSSGLILGSGHTHFPIQTNSHPFSDHHHHHHQEFSFVPEHLISPAGSNGGAFNLDFNMSTSSGAGAAVSAASGGFSGFNRGTLQSNSTNHHHQQQSFLANLQRFPSSESGGGPQFLFGTLPVENHHSHHNNHNNHQFQLYYENGCRNSDQKGKGKN